MRGFVHEKEVSYEKNGSYDNDVDACIAVHRCTVCIYSGMRCLGAFANIPWCDCTVCGRNDPAGRLHHRYLSSGRYMAVRKHKSSPVWDCFFYICRRKRTDEVNRVEELRESSKI